MKTIKITEEQRNELCYEIARLVMKFKKEKNVECIYITTSLNSGDIKGNVLNLTVVEQGWADEARKQKLERWNRMYQKNDFIRKLGFRIYIDTDNAEKYTTFALNPSEIARNQYLFNGTILFEQSGKYSRIKQQATEDFISKGVDSLYSHYTNLVEVVPPLADRIQYETEIRSMEEETAAVRESTRSQLFKEFKSII